MSQNNDDWDVQNLYDEDPKKAFYFLSKNIFDVQRLSKHIENAITSHVPLQEALFVLINEARSEFWRNFILSKKGISLIIGTIFFIAWITGHIQFSTLLDWIKNFVK